MTSKGEQYVEQTVAKLYAAEIRSFASWSEAEMEMYISLIRKDIDSLRKEIERM